MARYLITVPKDTYNGKTLGVKFNDGKAVVDEYTVPKNLGRSVDEVARLMKRDFGFEVKRITAEQAVEEVEETVEEAEKEKTAPPPPPKKGGRPKKILPVTGE